MVARLGDVLLGVAHVLLDGLDRLLGHRWDGALGPRLAQQGEHAGEREEHDGDDQRREPAVDGGRQREDRGRDQRADAVEREEPGTAEHAGTDPGLLALLGQLDLGQLELLADQRRHLRREVLDQLTRRSLS